MVQSGSEIPIAIKQRRARKTRDWSTIFLRADQLGWSISDIVRGTGCSPATVRRQAKMRGVELPRADSAPKHIDWAAEFRRAQELGETAKQLARRLKVSLSSVDKAKAKHGAALKRGVGAGPVCNDWPGELRKAIEGGETQADLARRLGIASQTVSLAAKRLGVTLRRGRGARASAFSQTARQPPSSQS